MLNGVLDNAYWEVVFICIEYVQVLLSAREVRKELHTTSILAKLWVCSKMGVHNLCWMEENQEPGKIFSVSTISV